MNEQLFLNRKIQRENDLSNEINAKKDDKDSNGVKSTNETTSKNKKLKLLTKEKKNLFEINNLKIDKKNLLFNEKNIYKNKKVKTEKLDKKNELQENINCNNNINEKDNKHDLKINNLWDLFFQLICLLIKKFNIEIEFPEHYSSYIFNNFKTLKFEKGFEKIKNLMNNDKLLMKEANHFFLERDKEIKKSSEKYESNQTGNIENKISIPEINNNNDNSLSENNKLEIIASAVIKCSLEKEENQLKKFKKETNLEDKSNKNIINNIIFDISKFHLNEHSIMCVISGIKFNNNITELDFSENSFNIRSSYWLGKLINSNKNLKKLELRNCNLDNTCLSMLIEGLKNDEENSNENQHGLERLNLKDNNKIKDAPNEENQICEILKIFKLKWLNLANTQLGNNGIIKLFKTYIDLLEQNKAYLENIIIINNIFKNEECLKYIGEALERPDCTIKTLILSKNLITTKNENNNINYFDKLMKSIGKNKSLIELFLVGCGIGKNHEDIDILYEMLSENKYLTSIRLFNNEINQFPDFHKIIEMFSDYKNNLKNTSLKILDLSRNECDIKIDDDFLDLIDRLKLEYLDLSQNKMKTEEKERFRDRVNALEDIKIIY